MDGHHSPVRLSMAPLPSLPTSHYYSQVCASPTPDTTNPRVIETKDAVDLDVFFLLSESSRINHSKPFRVFRDHDAARGEFPTHNNCALFTQAQNSSDLKSDDVSVF